MKLLFAHDHTFYKYKDKFYSTGGLSKEMLERYTNIFDEVVVISRQKEISKFDNKLTLASTDRVRFVSIPNFKSVKNLNKMFEAKRIINDEINKCDALISRLPSSIGSLALTVAKKKGKPSLVELVACPWDELWNHSFLGKIIAPYNYFMTKQKVREASFVVYVTNEFLQKRYPTKGKNVNCSNVALKKFDEFILRQRIEKINTENTNSKRIIGTTAAVNVKYKGQRYIIEALAMLKKQGIENFEYQLVGGGDQTYLKSIAHKYGVSDQVKFIGTIPHNEVFNWLQTIDIYAQPSRQEGLPRALIEAMSCGLPAIGAKTAGIPELLDSNFIFSNTNKNISEIQKILTSLNEDVMKTQAKRNYQEAKKYDKGIIDIRRRKFLNEFKEYSEQKMKKNL